jgi:hypothetical protein
MNMAVAGFDHEEDIDAAQGNCAVDVEESHASMVDASVRRNCRQVDRVRCVAGGIRSRFSTRRTVDAPTRYPRPSSSPWIRLSPGPGSPAPSARSAPRLEHR